MSAYTNKGLYSQACICAQDLLRDVIIRGHGSCDRDLAAWRKGARVQQESSQELYRSAMSVHFKAGWRNAGERVSFLKNQSTCVLIMSRGSDAPEYARLVLAEDKPARRVATARACDWIAMHKADTAAAIA